MQLAIRHGRHDFATPQTAAQAMIMAVPLLPSSSVAPPQHQPCCVGASNTTSSPGTASHDLCICLTVCIMAGVLGSPKTLNMPLPSSEP